MIVALDANIVIYLIEANPIWTPIATARLTTLRAAGDQIAFCDAGRLECLVKPLGSGNATDVATYQSSSAVRRCRCCRSRGQLGSERPKMGRRSD